MTSVTIALARALLIVGLLGGAPAYAQTDVSVDVGALGEDDYERFDALNLEKAVIVRLVQEGFAVVAVGEDAAVAVHCSSDSAASFLLVAESVEIRRAALLSPSDDLAAFHLEVAQKAVALVRSVQAAALDTSEEDTDTIAVLPSALPVQPQIAKRNATINVFAGAVYRGALDPQLTLETTLPLSSWLSAVVSVGLTPASNAKIEVHEWQALAGLLWNPLTPGPWRLQAGFMAGLMTHHFSVPQGSGTRIEPLFSLPVTLSRVVYPRISVGLRVAPGFAMQSREHLDGTEQLWQRSAGRVETLLHLQIAL